RHIGGNEGASEIVNGDGPRDQREREAARLAHGMQVDRGAVETEAPAEEREHERRADDPPSVEFGHRGLPGSMCPVCAGKATADAELSRKSDRRPGENCRVMSLRGARRRSNPDL